MPKKSKLKERIVERPKDFTWAEACTLMKQCGFKLINKDGSARMFKHLDTGLKAGVHEPHPGNILKPYAVDILIDALKAVGEL